MHKMKNSVYQTILEHFEADINLHYRLKKIKLHI